MRATGPTSSTSPQGIPNPHPNPKPTPNSNRQRPQAYRDDPRVLQYHRLTAGHHRERLDGETQIGSRILTLMWKLLITSGHTPRNEAPAHLQGFILSATGSWAAVFLLCAMMYVVGFASFATLAKGHEVIKHKEEPPCLDEATPPSSGGGVAMQMAGIGGEQQCEEQCEQQRESCISADR